MALVAIPSTHIHSQSVVLRPMCSKKKKGIQVKGALAPGATSCLLHMHPNIDSLAFSFHMGQGQHRSCLCKHFHHPPHTKTNHPMEVDLCGPSHRFQPPPCMVLCTHFYHPITQWKRICAGQIIGFKTNPFLAL